MNEIQKEIQAAFDNLSGMTVRGDNVDLLAIARSHLRNAYRLAEEKKAEEKTKKTEETEKNDAS